MPKTSVSNTYAGLSNQPPWRKQAGSIKDISNKRLSIDKGETTRNGMDLIRSLNELPSSLDSDDLLFVPFNDDIIVVGDGDVRAFNSLTGEAITVSLAFGPRNYLHDAASNANPNTLKQDFRYTIAKNTIFLVNKTVTVETRTSNAYVIKGEVGVYSELPANADVGDVYRVRFPEPPLAAGFYRRVNSGLTWLWIAASSQTGAVIVPDKMIHKIEKQTDGTYLFAPVNWADRRSGNDATNPYPDFINKQILDIAYHAGRLFTFSSTGISSSSSQSLDNFYVYDIANSTDVTNPVGHNFGSRVGLPLFSRSVGSDLFIACERGQIVFTSGQEQLTNVNGNDIQIASYGTKDIFPSLTGNAVLIVDTKDVIREFSSDGGVVSYSGDLNAHALQILEGYTPIQLFRFEYTTFIPTEEGTVFVHELALDGRDLVQTGWSKYNFNTGTDDDTKLVFADEQQGRIVMVFKHATEGFKLCSYYHGIESPVAGFPIAPCLDYRLVVQGTFIQPRNVTSFAYNKLTTSDGEVRVFTKSGKELEIVMEADSYVEARGRHDAFECIVGQTFEDFTIWDNFYPGVSSVRPTLSTVTVFFVDTLSFEFSKWRTNFPSDVRTSNYKTQYLLHDLITDDGIKTGHKAFTVMLDGRKANIKIGHKGCFPVTISAYEFDIAYNDISVR